MFIDEAKIGLEGAKTLATTITGISEDWKEAVEIPTLKTMQNVNETLTHANEALTDATGFVKDNESYIKDQIMPHMRMAATALAFGNVVSGAATIINTGVEVYKCYRGNQALQHLQRNSNQAVIHFGRMAQASNQSVTHLNELARSGEQAVHHLGQLVESSNQIAAPLRQMNNTVTEYASAVAVPLVDASTAVMQHAQLQTYTAFAEHVHDFVSFHAQEAGASTIPLTFVYHPSNRWHARFAKLRRSEPFGEGFVGCFNNLSGILDYLNKHAETLQSQSIKEVLILFPAFSHQVVLDEIKFPAHGLAIRLVGECDDDDIPMVHLTCRRTEHIQVVHIGILEPPVPDFGQLILNMSKSLVELLTIQESMQQYEAQRLQLLELQLLTELASILPISPINGREIVEEESSA